jgi:hypothetical protein
MKKIGLFLLLSFSLVACKKENVKEIITDNVIYELNDKVLYQTASEKTKQKSSTQFISMLYEALFHTAISSKELYELNQLSLSNGDKQFINNLIVENYINSPTAIIPTDAAMRADITAFLQQTYIRFYLRKPSEYELHYLKQMILADAQLSPRIIYQAFATSNEYLFY